MRTKISSYVIEKKSTNNVNKLERCYKPSELTELSKIIEFPYRRDFLGDTSVKIMLEKIFETDTFIRKEKWNIPDGKIISKLPMFKQLYYLLDIIVTSINDHWKYDQVIDYYSEYARIRTPGYGERYSPLEYWLNVNLHSRWNSTQKEYLTLEDIREMIYNNIQEARPAYSLISKSLYAALIEIQQRDTYKILDIAAYGERAIAASSLDKVILYDGVDPNYDLIRGHNLLSMDLQSINPNCQIRFIHVGMEDFKTSTKYDIITYSPPPFNTEPYGSSSNSDTYNNKTQSYIKYPTFNEYFCCFLTELIYKASRVSNDNAIFSFTALDRNPVKFPPKIKDKKQISEHLELVYVEALLLMISCFGFQYQGAIGLAAGGKSAGVPWWVFKYNKTLEPFYLQLLQEHYPDLFNCIASRIIANYHSIVGNIHPIFEDLTIRTKTDKYYISTFLPKKTSVFLELIRLQVQQYVIEVICKLTGLKIEKVRVLLGRYLMMRSINATYQMPWKSCLYVDPIFPTKDNDDTLIGDQIVTYLVEQGIDKDLANKVMYTYTYWFASYSCNGISELYHIIANYIHSLPISQADVTIKHSKDITIITGNDRAIDILKQLPRTNKVCGINYEIWRGAPNIDLLPYLRYETLGAQGHQYTRPVEKTEIIEKIFKMPIIDIYASIYNNQSKTYCSIYPDVEEHSIGSAFCLRMIEGAYLANPVDVPVFLSKSISIIIEDLHRAKRNNKILLVSMGFTVWTDTEDYFIQDFGNGISFSELFRKSSNIGLNMLSDSEFILAVYILNKKKYPSVLLDKVGNRDNTISVGVILGSKTGVIDEAMIEKLVEDKKYVQYR